MLALRLIRQFYSGLKRPKTARIGSMSKTSEKAGLEPKRMTLEQRERPVTIVSFLDIHF